MRFLEALMPNMWILVTRYSKGLDSFINKSLDSGHAPKRIDKYYAELNGRKLWVANYPYGYAAVNDLRPSRLTILRFRDALDASDFQLPS